MLNKTPDRVNLSRRLRREQTEAERVLWSLINNRQLSGAKFRRQVPIGPYIVDFVDPASKLIIELDGGQHNEPAELEQDAVRTTWLESQHYRVLRFWNNDVISNREGVAVAIIEALAATSPSS